VRIVSVGSGPAHEVYSFLATRPELGARLDVALIDQEERAIAHCERTLAPLAARTGARVRVIKASARRLLTDQKLGDALGTSDLVYSAGLFDYLADRSFSALLAVLYGAVERGGTLLVGNVAAHNPDRWAMEYFTEWFLYHRSEEELCAQARALAPAPSSFHVEAEPTGVNLFLVAKR
jgi:extracellular factor (EF) 3-hydroxypalmitic acid methyl ester biosynthesis protein